MRPPIRYYGGKQMLAARIVKLMPAHHLYCEPFFGGGAVFFAKQPSPVEIINDASGEVINFYRVMKTKFADLQAQVQATLYSRQLHTEAKVIYKNPASYTDVERAWAFWTLANQSIFGEVGGTWQMDVTAHSYKAHLLERRRGEFTEKYMRRLERVQIECGDALRVMDICDRERTFFYCDPPYFNADMGHYSGYTEQDFENLLQALSKIKGRFLLSSYPSDVLNRYIQTNGWQSGAIEMHCAASNKMGADTQTRTKTECLTWNYPTGLFGE